MLARSQIFRRPKVPTARQKRLAKKRQEELLGNVAKVFTALSLLVMTFFSIKALPGLHSWAIASAPLIQGISGSTPQPPKPEAPTDPAGYVRLNPACKPQRPLVAQRITKILNDARGSLNVVPPYVKDEAEAIFKGLDLAQGCVYSEQNLENILPNTEMSSHWGSTRFELTLILSYINDIAVDYQVETLYGLAHERTHGDIEGQYPSNEEGFIQDELEVERRVCDRGVKQAIGGAYSLPLEELDRCNSYWYHAQSWEEGIRKQYAHFYDLEVSK